MTVAPLRTARLNLRAPLPRDARLITRALNNFAVSQWMSVIPFPYGMTDAEWFINEISAGRERSWLIQTNDTFIGINGLGLDGELGYWVAQDAWGNGYATEAGRAVLDHHFTSIDTELVTSNHFVENTASRNVLSKLGFVDVGPLQVFSKARKADVEGRRMELSRTRWSSLQGA